MNDPICIVWFTKSSNFYPYLLLCQYSWVRTQRGNVKDVFTAAAEFMPISEKKTSSTKVHFTSDFRDNESLHRIRKSVFKDKNN